MLGHGLHQNVNRHSEYNGLEGGEVFLPVCFSERKLELDGGGLGGAQHKLEMANGS